MNAKQIITLIIFTLCGFYRSGSGVLVFETPNWDFREDPGSRRSRKPPFTGENRGDKPLVILDVVTSCGCTVPASPKRPILPGQKTEITVTYDPHEPSGDLFRKS